MAAIRDAGVDAGLGARAVVAVARVDAPFLGAGEEVGRVGLREGDAGRGHVFRLGRRRVRQLEVLLRLRQHVDGPAADDAVGGARDDIVGVLGPYDVEGVDRVRVPGACEGRLLHRCGFGPCVPEEDLPAVGAADD